MKKIKTVCGFLLAAGLLAGGFHFLRRRREIERTGEETA